MLPTEHAKTAFHYNHKSGDILSDDNMIVATIGNVYRRNFPALGHAMAVAAELVEALRTIAGMPIPEHDNMISANMRIIARAALVLATAP